jgi:hypothetical protein
LVTLLLWALQPRSHRNDTGLAPAAQPPPAPTFASECTQTLAPTQRAFPSATPLRRLSSPEAPVPPRYRKWYRRVMRLTERPHNASQNRVYGLLGHASGQFKAQSCLRQEVHW